MSDYHAAKSRVERFRGGETFWDIWFVIDLESWIRADLNLIAEHEARAILSALRRVEKLEAALGPLYEACMTADERGELAEEVNGEILDLARQALTGEV